MTAPTTPDEPALFLPDGDRFVPTVHTRGPWDPRAQHGGPPAALLARAVESVESPVPVRVVRLTVDLLRPVPLVPLEAIARTVRPGRRVQIVEASLRADGVEVARAAALRLRTTSLDLPEAPGEAPLPHGGPAEARPMRARPFPAGLTEAFPLTGSELRFVKGEMGEMGEATAWIRLRVPLVAGEKPSPLTRVAAAADFGNGISGVLDWSRRLYINPDLGIWLHRHPQGEWICLEAVTHLDSAQGSGMAESALWDERGRIGRSTQSLLVEAERTPA